MRGDNQKKKSTDQPVPALPPRQGHRAPPTPPAHKEAWNVPGPENTTEEEVYETVKIRPDSGPLLPPRREIPPPPPSSMSAADRKDDDLIYEPLPPPAASPVYPESDDDSWDDLPAPTPPTSPPSSGRSSSDVALHNQYRNNDGYIPPLLPPTTNRPKLSSRTQSLDDQSPDVPPPLPSAKHRPKLTSRSPKTVSFEDDYENHEKSPGEVPPPLPPLQNRPQLSHRRVSFDVDDEESAEEEEEEQAPPLPPIQGRPPKSPKGQPTSSPTSGLPAFDTHTILNAIKNLKQVEPEVKEAESKTSHDDDAGKISVKIRQARDALKHSQPDNVAPQTEPAPVSKTKVSPGKPERNKAHPDDVPASRHVLKPSKPESGLAEDPSQTNDALVFKNKMDPLETYPWYHGAITRDAATLKLELSGEDGTFLVRQSSKGGEHLYTITLVYQHRVYNLKVRLRHDGKFALGEHKDNEKKFDSLPELVDYHKTYAVVLSGESGEVTLQQSPSKTTESDI